MSACRRLSASTRIRVHSQCPPAVYVTHEYGTVVGSTVSLAAALTLRSRRAYNEDANRKSGSSGGERRGNREALSSPTDQRSDQTRAVMSDAHSGSTGERDHLVHAVVTALSSHERQGGLAYLRRDPLGAGEDFPAVPVPILTASTCHLAFVDPSPWANWGHDCRYLLVDPVTFASTSHSARLPPPDLGDEQRWQLVYWADGVPASLVSGPAHTEGES